MFALVRKFHRDSVVIVQHPRLFIRIEYKVTQFYLMSKSHSQIVTVVVIKMWLMLSVLRFLSNMLLLLTIFVNNKNGQ